MESSTRRATEPAPSALLAHSSWSSTRPSSSVRSTILSSVSPLRTQSRGPWASHSCLVEAARMLFTLEAVMNLLRNSLLMRKTVDRRRTELTEIFAFLCGFPAEFITRSSHLPTLGDPGFLLSCRGYRKHCTHRSFSFPVCRPKR